MKITSTRALRAESPNTPFCRVELPLLPPAEGEVLIRIRASGVNPLDLKIRAGEATHARHPLPAVLGLDLAGTVAATGPGVARFRVGDEVFGMTGGVGGHQGSLADYAVVDANLLALKPGNLSMREAAALPLIFITAYEGLVDRARIKAGDKVLVQGGGGGVGQMAVQLALAKGAEVYATDSGNRKDYIESLGATAIDNRTETVEQYVDRLTGGDGFDIVYDTAGGASLDASFQAARAHEGHVVSCLGWGMHALAPLSFRAATYSGIFTLLPLLSGKGRAHHGAILAEAAGLAEVGKLMPRLDPTRYTLSEADAAHNALRHRTAQGKIVVEID